MSCGKGSDCKRICTILVTMYKSEQIAEIRWTVTGKVSDVTRTGGSSKPDLHFDYDAMGQRIAKTVTNKNTTDGTDKFVTTYYVRDPQGNVLAVYEHKHGDSDNGTFTLAEQHLYGAGRLGMRKRDLALNVANANESTPPATHYELTNHLGNVMAVISDKASDTSEPTVVSLSDYYPFGMTEPGRSWNAGDYRFGYTGHEKENDLAEGVYTTEYRLLDTRLGRWMSVDPLAKISPSENTYNYCSGNPIIFWDSDGRIKCKEDGTLDITYDDEVVNPLLEQRRQQYDAIDPGNPMNPYSGSNGYKYGVAYTDKGTPFIVMTYIGEGSKHDRAVNNTNCFGACFLGGQAFIPCGIDAQVILDEEYAVTPKTERSTSTPEVMNYQAGDVSTAMNGDIVIYTNSRWGTIPQHASEIVEIVPPYEISENKFKMSVNLFSKDGRNEPRDITLNMQIIIDGINPITSEPFQIYNQLWSYEEYGNAESDNKTVYRRISGKNVPKDVIKKEVTEDNIINEDY